MRRRHRTHSRRKLRRKHPPQRALWMRGKPSRISSRSKLRLLVLRHAHGEKCRRGRPFTGDLLKLREVLAKRFGHFDLGVFQGAEQLQGVYNGLALEMVVGDDEGVAGVLVDRTDALDPGIEFIGGIKIVVALVTGSLGIVAKPSVVSATVQTDITDRRSTLGGRSKRAADERLVDVAKTGVEFAEQVERFRRVPGGVAKFDDQRIVGEAFQGCSEEGDRVVAPMERERELCKDSAEFSGVPQDLKTRAD